MATTGSRGGGSRQPSSGGGGALTQKIGPLPVWGWLAIGVVVYLVFFHKKSTTATASTTGTGTVTQGQPLTETVSYPTGESYSGPVGYAPGTQGGGYSGGSGSSSSGSPGRGNPHPGGTPSGTATRMGGPQVQTVGGQSVYELGYFTGAGNYLGSTVSGGYPVEYTYAGNSTPTVGGAPSGASNVVLYTPATTPTSAIGAASNKGVPAWSKGYT